LTPKDHSTAGKQRLGSITRAGDEELRRVLVVGAMAVVQRIKRGHGAAMPWLSELVARKPAKLAAVALANKNVRIAWRLMVSGQRYDHRRRAASAQAASVLPAIDNGGASAVGEEKATVPIAARMTPCSPPSRTLRAASGGGLRPSLTASARGVSATAQVGTKKRPSGRTKKLTKKTERSGAFAPN
jgi:transposase